MYCEIKYKTDTAFDFLRVLKADFSKNEYHCFTIADYLCIIQIKVTAHQIVLVCVVSGRCSVALLGANASFCKQ